MKHKKHQLIIITRRLVNFRENLLDRKVAIYGALGFGSKFISREVKLSEGQVNYRLKRANIKRSNYRNGSSPFAKIVVNKASEAVESKVMQSSAVRQIT